MLKYLFSNESPCLLLQMKWKSHLQVRLFFKGMDLTCLQYKQVLIPDTFESIWLEFEYRYSEQCLHLLGCSEQEFQPFSSRLKLFWNWYLHNNWVQISFINALLLPNEAIFFFFFNFYEVFTKILWMIYLKNNPQWNHPRNLLLARYSSENRVKQSYWGIFDIQEVLHWRHSNFTMWCQQKPSEMCRVQPWILPLNITCILNKWII